MACPPTHPAHPHPHPCNPQVRSAIFEEAAPGNVTVGSTYNRCSYGKTQLTANNSLLVDPVQLPCDGVT